MLSVLLYNVVKLDDVDDAISVDEPVCKLSPLLFAISSQEFGDPITDANKRLRVTILGRDRDGRGAGGGCTPT